MIKLDDKNKVQVAQLQAPPSRAIKPKLLQANLPPNKDGKNVKPS